MNMNNLPLVSYCSLVSPYVSVIPFCEHIDTVRASLNHTYMIQAVCKPAIRTYEHSGHMRPLYSQVPLIVSAAINVDATNNCKSDTESKSQTSI